MSFKISLECDSISLLNYKKLNMKYLIKIIIHYLLNQLILMNINFFQDMFL